MKKKPISWTREGTCMISVNSRDTCGYPQMMRNGIKRKICRFILLKKYGEQPRTMVCRHTCDVPACINPDHIIIGTVKDNVRDSFDRGRAHKSKGETHHFARLKEFQVLEIKRLLAARQAPLEIADKFGVNLSTIRHIMFRRTWKYLP